MLKNFLNAVVGPHFLLQQNHQEIKTQAVLVLTDMKNVLLSNAFSV